MALENQKCPFFNTELPDGTCLFRLQKYKKLFLGFRDLTTHLSSMFSRSWAPFTITQMFWETAVFAPPVHIQKDLRTVGVSMGTGNNEAEVSFLHCFLCSKPQQEWTSCLLAALCFSFPHIYLTLAWFLQRLNVIILIVLLPLTVTEAIILGLNRSIYTMLLTTYLW